MRAIAATIVAAAGCASHAPRSAPAEAAPDVQVLAVDADGARLRDALALDLSYVAPAASVRVTGRFAGDDPLAVRDALIAAYPALAVSPLRAGADADATSPVSLDFHDADLADVFRVLAAVVREELVVAPGVPRVDVHVRHQPAGAVIEAAIAALGLTVERVDSLTYVHPRGTPGLEPVGEPGATVELTAIDAFAGELDALLEAVGAGGHQAACDAGALLQVELHRATAGATAAVITALSGASGGRCALPRVSTAPDDGALIATVRQGDDRAALYRAGGRAVIVAPSDAVLTLPVADEVPVDEVVARGRPAAVVRTADHACALYELDGAWAFGDAAPGLEPR